ncbi:hypothetical protein GF402_05275 [Candidatus Fermentibacteria bacterium]|nr:hypothetical protein [Candidatus Fermentibacteria bacterium]
MKKFLVLSVIIALGCGDGTRIELRNSTGAAISDVTITVGAVTLSWDSLGMGESVSGKLSRVYDDSMVIRWNRGSRNAREEVQLIERAAEAQRINIVLSTGGLHLDYSF